MADWKTYYRTGGEPIEVNEDACWYKVPLGEGNQVRLWRNSTEYLDVYLVDPDAQPYVEDAMEFGSAIGRKPAARGRQPKRARESS